MPPTKSIQPIATPQLIFSLGIYKNQIYNPNHRGIFQMNDQNCPICLVKVNQSGSSGGADIYDYDCPVCGHFSIKKLALHNLRSESRDERTSAVISHAIRRMQKQTSWPEIDTKMLDTILQDNELPSPIEQADNLIMLIGDKIKIPGEYIILNPLLMGGVDMIISSAKLQTLEKLLWQSHMVMV